MRPSPEREEDRPINIDSVKAYFLRQQVKAWNK
jgi:hypothetical protein